MAFADGHVRFISEDMEYHVYQQIMTPNSKKSDSPFPAYVVSDSDLD